MGHKGGQRYVYGTCIVRTAVCQKAPFWLKQCQKIKLVSLAIIKLHLPEGIIVSQSGSRDSIKQF